MQSGLFAGLALVALAGQAAAVQDSRAQASAAQVSAATPAQALAGRWKSEVKNNHSVTLTVKDGQVSADWREGGSSRIYRSTLENFVAQGGFTRNGAVTVAYTLHGPTLTLDAKDPDIRGIWTLSLNLTWARDGRQATYRGQPLEYWAERLPEADVVEREALFEAIRTLEDDARPLIPALGAVLKSQQPGAREGALERLAAFGPAAKSTAPQVLALVRDPSDYVRMWAVRAIPNIGTDARDAVPVLVQALGDSKPHVRREAAAGLAHYPAAAEAAVPALSQLLNDPDLEPRQAAVSALAVFGEQAKSASAAVAKSLTSGLEGNQRLEAINTLRKIGAAPAVAVPALAAALKDRRIDVAGQAADALRDYGPAAKAATDALATAIQDGRERRAQVRKRAEAALQVIDPDAARAVAERKRPWPRDPAVEKQMQALQGVWKSAPRNGTIFVLEARGEEVLLRSEGDYLYMANGSPKLRLEDLVMDSGLTFFRGASLAEFSCRFQDGMLIVASESRDLAGVWVLSR